GREESEGSRAEAVRTAGLQSQVSWPAAPAAPALPEGGGWHPPSLSLNHRQQKHTTICRARGVLHSRRQHEQISGCQLILAPQRLEDDIALENLDRDRPGGAVSRQVAASSKGNERQPERACLDQGAGTPAMLFEQCTIDCAFIAGKVMNQDVTVQGAVH